MSGDALKLSVDSLARELPWRQLLGGGVIRNDDGSLQKTFRLYGADLSGQSEDVKGSAMLQANNAIRRLGDGDVIHSELARFAVTEAMYPRSRFSHPLAQHIDDQSRRAFLTPGTHFVSDYYVTLRRAAPSQAQSWLDSLVMAGESPIEPSSEGSRVAAFRSWANHIAGLLGGHQAMVPLTDAETLTYLHQCVSYKRHKVKVPDIPLYLNAQLIDCEFQGGYDLRLGPRWLQTVTINDLPDESISGLLTRLDDLGIELRFVNRYIALPKPKARRVMRQIQGQYHGQRMAFWNRVMATFTGGGSSITDSDAENKRDAVDLARQEIGADLTGFGYFSAVVVVWDDQAKHALEKAYAVEEVINDQECVASVDSQDPSTAMNLEDAWFGTQPGDVRHNLVRLMESSLNYIHTMPGVLKVWTGHDWNPALDGPPHFYATTASSTPFKAHTYVDKVGHTLIPGPSGKGKTTLLNWMALQFDRYPDARVSIMDFKGGLRCVTLGLGGEHIDLGQGVRLFQPLRDLDSRIGFQVASQWVGDRLEEHQVVQTAEVSAYKETALETMKRLKPSERTLTTLVDVWQQQSRRYETAPMVVGPDESRQSVKRDGLNMGLAVCRVFEPMLGGLLDGDRDVVFRAKVICFEWESLFKTPHLIAGTLSHLWRLLEDSFTGQPTLLICDEMHKLAEHPMVVNNFDHGLRLWRFRNVAFIAATQEVGDITKQHVLGRLLIQCPTRIYLPNPSALSPSHRDAYKDLDVTTEQLHEIHQLPQGNYFFQQLAVGARAFRLKLTGDALAMCGRNSLEDHQRMTDLYAQYGKDDFWRAWLAACREDGDASDVWHHPGGLSDYLGVATG
jgi:type IV secretory pathway VirB4 component